MSDFRTLRQTVIDDWHLDDSGDIDDHIHRAICAALNDMRTEEFPWNTGIFTMDTVVDQASYAIATMGGATANLLPWDFLGVLGDEIALDESKQGASPIILKDADVQTFTTHRWWLNQSGTPRRWMYYQDKLWLGPNPPDSIDEITVRYLKDLGTPDPSYNGSTWDFLDAAGAAINTDTFTTAWFTEALEVLAARVAWRFFTTHERNEKDAAAALAVYNGELATLQEQRGPKQVVGKIEPFLGGRACYGDGSGMNWNIWNYP